jgi:ribosomal protein L7/L12
MTTDSIVSIALGISVAVLVRWAMTRTKTRDAAPNLPLTTATNPAILAAGPTSTGQSERLQQLVESGALTHDEYTVLTGSSAHPDGDSARLSILHNGPNKIQDIKALRASFKLGLREAKDIVDNLPQTFVAPMPYARAQAIALQLQSAGMTTHIT